MSKPLEIPTAVGDKKLDSRVEELADYLSVNCGKYYADIVAFGRARFNQGVIYGAESAAKQLLPKPSNVSLKPLFEKLCAILGHQNMKYTPARAAKLKRRLKLFSEDDLCKAATLLSQNEYMMGDNPNGKKYGTVDYLLRNDEKIDEWLDGDRGSVPIDLSKLEF